MKCVIFLSPLLLVISFQSHAVKYQGVSKNVVMACASESGSKQVLILSDNYTTRGYGKLTEDPGLMYTIEGRLVSGPNDQTLIDSATQSQPLQQVDQTGFFDETLGIYENTKYRLDLRSRSQEKITLETLSDGEKLICRVHGDCC